VKIKLPSLVNTLLLLAIAVAITYWFLQWVSLRTSPESVVAVPVGDRVARSQPLDVSAAAAVFGASPSGIQDGNSALALSSIRLDGVIAEGGRGKGIALISVDNRPSLAFRAGDAIAGNLTLVDVRGDHIVITSDQGTHDVRMPARTVPTGIVPAQ
jgi:hypothetical protein